MRRKACTEMRGIFNDCPCDYHSDPAATHFFHFERQPSSPKTQIRHKPGELHALEV